VNRGLQRVQSKRSGSPAIEANVPGSWAPARRSTGPTVPVADALAIGLSVVDEDCDDLR
jgi:hypothetical protein